MVMSSKGSIDTFQIDQTVHVLFKLGLGSPQKSRNNNARNIIILWVKTYLLHKHQRSDIKQIQKRQIPYGRVEAS